MQTNGVLFDDLKGITARIQKFSSSNESDIESMSQQLVQERPGLAVLTATVPLSDIAKEYLDAVRGMPKMIQDLTGLLEAEVCGTACRHAVVLALVFLVRSDDLIPDETPGGYGFIDDYIVLRVALSAVILSRVLNEGVLRFLCPDEDDGRSRRNKLRKWARESGHAVTYLTLGLPPEKHAAVQNLIEEVGKTYLQCIAWAVVNPESLEHRTQQLIANPRLPGPVLTHPVDDDSLWSKWEAAEAEKRRNAMDEETSRSLWEYNRQWADWNRRIDQIRDGRPRGTLGFPLPGGGMVATDGRNVYVAPKPGH